METEKTFTIYGRITAFKSYYVVWKQAGLNKTKRVMKKFKSYYVVWKQFDVKFEYFEVTSLNRTM